MNELINIFKALSDRNRLRIVSALIRQDELCACQITELIKVTAATISRHMSILTASGLVRSRKDGRWVYYHLCRKKTDTHALLDWIRVGLSNDPAAEHDAKVLDKIISCKPETLCKKQRDKECHSKHKAK